MDFSKLNQNEKWAVYGAAASVIGPILATAGFGFGVGWLTLLLALAMLAIVFLPQMSPQTTLPGSKGSLMVLVGGIAGLFALLALLSGLGYIGLFGNSAVFVIGWLLGIAGGLLMGWAGWREFQAEGGKFQLGTQAPAAGSTTRTDAAAPPPSEPAPSSYAEPEAPAAPEPMRPSEPAPPATDEDDTRGA